MPQQVADKQAFLTSDCPTAPVRFLAERQISSAASTAIDPRKSASVEESIVAILE
jgi:hypothetical protein